MAGAVNRHKVSANRPGRKVPASGSFAVWYSTGHTIGPLLGLFEFVGCVYLIRAGVDDRGGNLRHGRGQDIFRP